MLLNSGFKTLSTLICISFFLNNNRRQLMYWTIKGHTFWMLLCLDTIYALTFNPFTAETLQFASIDMYKVVHSLYNNIQLYLLIILTPYLYIFVRNCSVICSEHQCVYKNASLDIPNNLKNVIQNIEFFFNC